jgi:hypothetical protein
MTLFWGEKFYNSCKLAQIFFFTGTNEIIQNFVIIVATKKGRTEKFSTSNFVAVLGSVIGGPRSGIRDWWNSGSGIRNKRPESATLLYTEGTGKVITCRPSSHRAPCRTSPTSRLWLVFLHDLLLHDLLLHDLLLHDFLHPFFRSNLISIEIW